MIPVEGPHVFGGPVHLAIIALGVLVFKASHLHNTNFYYWDALQFSHYYGYGLNRVQQGERQVPQ